MSADDTIPLLNHGPRPLAYSYLRFSTDDQIKDDTIRRQLAVSAAYAEAQGFYLVQEYKDLGVSAFRGLNQSDGQLALFVAAVEGGAIPSRCHLLVESLDRLSRQKPRVALRHFLHLVDLGVTIHTLMDGNIYSDARLDDNPMLLFASIMVMCRSSEESETKSIRGRQGKAQLRERAAADGTVMTKQCPAWLRVITQDGRRRFEVIPDRANLIRRMFQMTIDGLGSDSIVRLLNSEGIPSFSAGMAGKQENGWQKSYVCRVIIGRAVCGDYVPLKAGRESIPNYYPRVIDEGVWARTQAARAGRDRSGGPKTTTGFNNLFSGLGRCAMCGGMLSVKSKGVPLPGLFNALYCVRRAPLKRLGPAPR